MREAFKVDDEEFRSLVYFHFLLRVDVLLAAATVPLVSAGERLLHREVVKTIVEGELTTCVQFELLILVGNSRKLAYFKRLFEELQVGLGILSPVDSDSNVSSV